MTEIIHRRAGERHELEVRGHAAYGPTGHDVVCAAISTAVNIMAAALQEDEDALFELNEGDCRLVWSGHEEVWSAVCTAFFHLSNDFSKYVSYISEK